MRIRPPKLVSTNRSHAAGQLGRLKLATAKQPGGEETIPLQRRRWSPAYAIGVAILLYTVAEILAGLIIAIYPHLQGWSRARSETWAMGAYVQFVAILIAEGITVAGLVWFMRRRRISLKDIGWRRFRLINIVYALAAFGVYFVAYIVLVQVASSAIPDLNVNQQQDIGFNHVTGAGQLFVTAISLIVLPPLVEETLFRGFLFTTFRHRMKFVWALLLTSGLFALPHLFEADSGLLWIGLIDTFVLSAVLCYVREKTGSLWSGVLVHALKNGLAFLSLYIIHAR